MSALFRSLNSGFSVKRETAVKEAILEALEENIGEIEFEAKKAVQETLELCESTNSLATTIEAIFLHGLKDSFLWQTLNIIADVERRPEPSFWSPIMVFLHKEVIEQITSLTQITSEVGQCRAFVRLSLNDGLLSSYLNNMRKSSSSLSPYYKSCAFVKDSKYLERAAGHLDRIEGTICFNLPFSSSLLNQWPDNALQLSGLWTPTLKSCPISSGLDIANSLTEKTIPIPTPQPLQTNELFSESISNSPFQRSNNFPVDEINTSVDVDLFLQNLDEMQLQPAEDLEEAKVSQDVVLAKSDENKDPCDNSMPSGSNCLSSLMHKSWCSSDNSRNTNTMKTESKPEPTCQYQRSQSVTSSVYSITSSTMRSPSTEKCSYNALLRKHERQRDINWAEVWGKFLHSTANSLGSEIPNNSDNDTAEIESSKSDFEIVSTTATDHFDIDELREMVEQLCKLAREQGLDSQGFLCKGCQHPLGVGYSSFRVCAFSGYYYCEDCMSIDKFLIPAKIIYNWDFRKYNVCKKSAIFLAEFRTQPFIDIKVMNPDIYNACEVMAGLQALRIRLNFIRVYLNTCSSHSLDMLQRLFFGKEYLYEHIHEYSIGDLAMIESRTLYASLQEAFKLGEEHVLKCHLCSQKGFICEICNGARILYPFHIETTYRCAECGAVFHANCLNDKQPCPKCQRRRKRNASITQEEDNTSPGHTRAVIATAAAN